MRQSIQLFLEITLSLIIEFIQILYFSTYIIFGLIILIIKNYFLNFLAPKHFPRNRRALLKIIQKEMKLHGDECDLNHINVSRINDMYKVFANSNFNGNISKWDVSSVEDMEGMFFNSSFNGNISQWNTSKVRKMHGMFAKSKFNGDISRWDVSNVEDMREMFCSSQFSQNLINWIPLSLEFTDGMFDSSLVEAPYWAFFEDKNSRNKEIIKYIEKKQLHYDLQINLINNSSKIKKIKI